MRIRAASEDEARHASILLSDALHTASLPLAAHGQMLIVRNLSLGRISAQASSASLALRLERALRKLIISAVPFDTQSARTANAVSFPCHAEAIVRLARLHARGVAANEWFWPEVAPAWASGLSRGDRWLALIDAAHTLPQAALVVAAVVCEAMRAFVEDELLCAIPPGRGAEWLQLEGWGPSELTAAEPAAPLLSIHQDEIVQRWQHRWGSHEKRLVWLVTMLLLIERPALAADENLPGKAARWLASAFDRARTVPQPQVNPSRYFPDIPMPTAEAQLSELKRQHSSPESLPADTPNRDVPGPPGNTLPSEPSERKEAMPDAFAPHESPECSEPEHLDSASFSGSLTWCAGLLFLVPVLERLGFADFLALHPVLLETGLPARLLQFVAERVGIKPDDPLMLALGEPDRSETGLLSLELPVPVLKILACPAPRGRLDSPLMVWLTAVRRWCRRNARIGLASLVRRPGRVAVTRTHLDLIFNLADSDLRTRRVALDVDPGWVPWLGRVVQFHYLERHELGD